MPSQRKLNAIFLNAVVDGCTGAALFGRLRWFGAPEDIIDTRSIDEYKASQDFVDDCEVALDYRNASRISPKSNFSNQDQALRPAKGTPSGGG